MYNRRFFDSQLGKVALVSITAMVVLNIVAALAAGTPSLGTESGFDVSLPSLVATLS